ncbi:MAG: hypothetical protein IKK40_05775 [Bacteroidales bacterium]|nr:hypothetical protein [Bacteroidales bacterium]
MISNLLVSMSVEEIKDQFLGKKVRVITDNDGVIDGIVSEVGLATNPNPQDNVHLPVTIKVGGEVIDIFYIKDIELL